jgi:predicted MFS family arabinose efflux permease
MNLPPGAGDGEFRKSWSVAAASSVAFGLGLSGLPFYTMGVFIDPLAHAFGWTAADVQSGLLVMLWGAVVLSPCAGWAVDRFGPRPVASVSVFLFGLSFMSLSLGNGDLLLFRLRWILIASAGAGTLPLVWGKVIALRFERSRGLALGLVLAGSGVTGFVAPPLAQALIDHFGWRAAYAGLGALPLLLALPLVVILLPASPGGGQDGEFRAPGADLAGSTLGHALASPRFWLIAIAIAVVAAAAAGCISNLVNILSSHGQTRGTAVWIASLVGLFVVAGRAASGVLLDRYWAPGIAAAFLAAPAAGCLLLVFESHSLGWAALAAILIGLAAGAEFDLLAYLLAAYFGLRRYGVIYGAASAAFGFAAGAAPIVFAAAFDRTGSYDVALLGAAAAFAVGGSSLLFLGACPKAFLEGV